MIPKDAAEIERISKAMTEIIKASSRLYYAGYPVIELASPREQANYRKYIEEKDRLHALYNHLYDDRCKLEAKDPYVFTRPDGFSDAAWDRICKAYQFEKCPPN